MNKSVLSALQWAISRVAVIYVIAFLFGLTCMDLKMLQMRIKVRHLNDAIPDFSDMILFSRHQNIKNSIDWKPYKDYFKLILRYEPDDLRTMELLGYVDYYTGQEPQAIGLFKSSMTMEGRSLFWSNYNLGVLYYKRGMWAQAAEYLLKAISSNTQLAVVLMNDSLVYRQIFNSPYFKYSISDEIKNAQTDAYILLLSSFYNMKQYDKTIMIANLALKNPGIARQDAFYYYEGLALMEMGQLRDAFFCFQKSLAIEKDNPDVYYYLSDIYEKLGQLGQAKALLQVSYALHQKNDPRFPYDTHVDPRFF